MNAKNVTPAVAATTVNPITPPYWDEACKHLSKRDRVMRKLIADHGQARLFSRGNAFTTLARSIVGQQISVKAAQSVWEKLLALVGQDPSVERQPLAVEDILSRAPEELRTAGLSARKVEYLQDLARHFADGKVHVDQWNDMLDVPDLPPDARQCAAAG